MTSNTNYLVDFFRRLPTPSLVIKSNAPLYSILEANDAYLKKTGKTHCELIGKSFFEVFPETDYASISDNISLSLSFDKVLSTKKIQTLSIQENSHSDDFSRGVIRHWKAESSPIFDKEGNISTIMYSLIDITENSYFKELENLEKDIWGGISRGDCNYNALISEFILKIEILHPGMICSVQQVFDNKLYNLASPSLSKEYLEAISGIEIGNNIGSCGTAAFLKKKVVVTDISTDTRWTNYKEVASKYDLKACWSYPILNYKEEVIATFAIYYHENKTPSILDEHTILRASIILKIILQISMKEIFLKESEIRFQSLVDWYPEAIAVHRNGVVLYVNDAAVKLFEASSTEELLGKSIAERIHPDFRQIVKQRLTDINEKKSNEKSEQKGLKMNGNTVDVEVKSILIPFGEQNAVLSSLVNITERKKLEKEKELERIDKEALINNIDDLIWSVDKNFQLVAGNKAFFDSVEKFSKIILKKGDLLINKHIFPEDIIDFWRALYTKALLGISVNQELFTPGSDSTQDSWLKLNINPIWKENEIIGIACYGKNITVRKLIEIELQKKEKQYRNIVESYPDAISIYKNGEQLFVNNAVLDLIGVKSKEELAGKIVNDFIHPDFHKEMDERMQLLKNSVVVLPKIEVKLIKSNGTEIDVETEGIIVTFNNEPAVQVITRDITLRKQSEKFLFDSENRYKALVELSPDAIAVHRKGILIYVNLPAIKMFGVELADELLGKSFFEIVRSDFHLKLIESMNNFDENLEHPSIDLICIKKDKVEIDVKIHGKVIIFGGEPSVLVSLQNITIKKQKEDELNLLSLVAKRTSNAVIITDEKRNITWVNDGFTRITGYLFEEVIGLNPGKLLLNSNSDLETITHVRKKLDLKESVKFEIFNVSKFGREYWLDIEIQPMLSPDGVLKGFIAIESEITERKQKEIEHNRLLKDLTKNNQELLQFSYIVSHNLRGPVASILGLINVSNCIKDVDIKEIMTMIHSSTLHLDMVIRDLNEILDLRKPSERKKFLYFNEILRNTEGLLGKSLFEHDVDLKANFNELEGFKFVTGQIQSIFYNIISNSIKYRKEGIKPEISIRTYLTTESAFLEFCDNGIGIDLKRHKEKIFGLYQRFSNLSEGKGIGLFLVKNCTEAMGGEIEIQSELGEGVKIILKFPLTKIIYNNEKKFFNHNY